MNTWASQSTSFPKGVISCFHRTLFLFINWISRQLGRSHTESTDTANKTFVFLLTKRSYPTCCTLMICWVVPRYVLAIGERASMRRSLSFGWRPTRRETIAGFILPVTARPTKKSTDPVEVSRLPYIHHENIHHPLSAKLKKTNFVRLQLISIIFSYTWSGLSHCCSLLSFAPSFYGPKI